MDLYLLLGLGGLLLLAGVMRLEFAGLILIDVDCVEGRVRPRYCIILSRDSLSPVK